MTSVARITPELKRVNVPDQLKTLPAWLCWRAEQHDDEPKPRKVPYYAAGGRRVGQQGSSEDRSKLVTFAAAIAAAQRLGMTGVGFAPLPDFGLTFLDFDKCVGPNGELPQFIADLTSRTWSEYSPSGTGIHVGLQGNLGDRRSPVDVSGYGLDVFSEKGFLTFTGNMLPHTELLGLENAIAPVTTEIAAFVAKRFGENSNAKPSDPDDFTIGFEPKLGMTITQIEEAVNKLDPDMDRDHWIRVGLAVHHETEGGDDGFDIWNEWSSLGATYGGDEACRYQWDSFKGPQRGVKSTTMATVLHMGRQPSLCVPVTPERLAAKAEAIMGDLPASHGPCTPPGFGGKFPIVSFATAAERKPTPWLIKGVLPKADLVLLYGASGAGKSFVALDMAVAISRGEDWFGNRTGKCRGLIIAAEGAGGYGKRIRALCQTQGLDVEDIDVGLLSVAPNVLLEDDITQLIASVNAVGEVGFVIVDTFAQVTPGSNENSGEDMGKALGHLRTLSEITKATVMPVHHAGKDLSRGLRGWSGLHAAADAVIEVTRDEANNARAIRTAKQKDGDDNRAWGFRLDTVVIGMDEDGDEETSCVITQTDVVVPVDNGERKGVKRRGRMERHVLEIVALQETGTPGMRFAELVQQAADALPAPDPDKRDTRRQVVTRAIQSLVKEKEGPIGLEGQYIIFYT